MNQGSTRIQHLVPATIILMVGVWVAWISFTQKPAAAFLFPRVISVVFVALAIWNFLRAALGYAKVGNGIDSRMLVSVLPGLAVGIIYVFYAAKALGFYVAGALAFFLVYTLYDPVPYSEGLDWVKRIAVTAIFIAIIYALFALVLQVQTPRGMFF